MMTFAKTLKRHRDRIARERGAAFTQAAAAADQAPARAQENHPEFPGLDTGATHL